MFQKNLNYVPNKSRILVRNADQNLQERPFFVTLTRNDEGRKYAVDDQGRRYNYAMNWKFEPVSPDVPSLCVLWSGPFPMLGEEGIIDFYQSVLPSLRSMENMSATPLIIHLADVGETSASGYIVNTAGTHGMLRHVPLDDQELVRREHTVWSAEPIKIARETLPLDAAIGDLVISESFYCVGEKIGDDDGEVLVKTMLVNARAIARNCAQEDVLRHMPSTHRPNTFGEDFGELAFDYLGPTPSFELATLEDHKWLVASALAEFDPNFAIVLLVTDEEGQQHIFDCGKYGRELFGLDNLLEELDGADIKEGAWAFVKPRIVSGYSESHYYPGRDYYFDLDGDFVPLTEEHLASVRLDLATLGANIIENLRELNIETEDDPAELAKRYMALAESNHEYPAGETDEAVLRKTAHDSF